MPDFVSRLPQFLGFRRSHLRSQNAAPAAAAHSPGPDPASTSSNLSSHGRTVPEQDVNSMAGTCRQSIGDVSVDHQHPTDQDNFTGQLLPVLQPVITIGAVDLNSAPTFSPQDLVAQQPSHPPSPRFSQPEHQNIGMFHQAHNLSVTGNFIDGDVGSVVYMTVTSNQFMERFLEKTIAGAAFDSSARDPPPRCHPGTRLAVLKRCMDFVSNSGTGKRMRWIVGAAGVGKSAIMQSVAESPKLLVASQASVFFSINGRNDGSKIIMTLSYQLAAKSEVYRQIIEDDITRDPSLFQSSMAVQFEKFLVQPFIHNAHLNSAGRVLIVIDGLDECSNKHSQIELLRLILNLCLSYPSSPFVWLIASRPEIHITSFFSRTELMPVFEKEEILVDSDEGRADVERFLRNALAEMKIASDSLDPQWPDEQDLWKLANAAGGLFAYADTVMRYISDTAIGSPASQLSDVLHLIDNHPMMGVPGEEHPMALLDALYARILSKVPSKIMINARKFLLALASDWDSVLHRPPFPPHPRESFILLCNWLHMTPDDAYAAINPFRSVLRVPRRDKAHEEKLVPFHKSFIDYVSDFTRSGFSLDIQYEAQQLKTQCSFRILKEAPDGLDFGEVDYGTYGGILARGPGPVGKISLTWQADEEQDLDYSGTRMSMYKLAIREVIAGIEFGDPAFQSVSCIRLLTTVFEEYDHDFFPHDELCAVVFDESRRHEFMMYDILKEIPLKAVGFHSVFGGVELRFRRLTTIVANLSDPWNPSCQHEREGEWGEGNDQNWVTTFSRNDCAACYSRFEHQLGRVKLQSSDCAVPVLFTSAGECCVEFQFVDEEDSMSEWVYRFWYELILEECGSSV